MTAANPTAKTRRWRYEPEYHRTQSNAYGSARYYYRSAWYREALATQTCAVCGDRADQFVHRAENAGDKFRPLSCLSYSKANFVANLARMTPLCFRCAMATKYSRAELPDVRTNIDALPPMPW